MAVLPSMLIGVTTTSMYSQLVLKIVIWGLQLLSVMTLLIPYSGPENLDPFAWVPPMWKPCRLQCYFVLRVESRFGELRKDDQQTQLRC